LAVVLCNSSVCSFVKYSVKYNPYKTIRKVINFLCQICTIAGQKNIRTQMTEQQMQKLKI
jgi:hypothetical protein